MVRPQALQSDGVGTVAVLNDLCQGPHLSNYLTTAGFYVHQVSDEVELNVLLSSAEVDAVVLDLGAPLVRRLDYCRTLSSRHSSIGILTLGASSDVSDKVIALEFGADDYLQVPVNLRELLARLRAVLRGRHAKPRKLKVRPSIVYEFGGWTFDMVTHYLMSPNGVIVDLTPNESSLLRTLVCASQRMVTRGDVLQIIGRPSRRSRDRSIDILVSRVRKKISDSEGLIVRTIRNGGYAMAVQSRRVW